LCDNRAAATSTTTTTTAAGTAGKKLEAFLGATFNADKIFLKSSGPRCEHVQSDGGASSVRAWSGTLAHCTDRRIWTETNLIVNKEGISVVRRDDPMGILMPNYKNKPKRMTIPAQSLLFVRCLEDDLCPFPGFGFFEIETFFKVYVFMVHDQSNAEAWVNIFVKLFGNKIKDAKRLPLEKTFVLPDVDVDLCLSRPSSLKLGKRRVFNYRRIVFPSRSTLAAHLIGLTPNQVIEKALTEAFQLISENTNAQLWIDFMETVSALQVVELSSLSIAEKTAFLLNLYHTMVIHGMLILGPPIPSSWGSFFDTVSYLVGYDVVSINDLECNGLR
jgi:hypothetical protein